MHGMMDKTEDYHPSDSICLANILMLLYPYSHKLTSIVIKFYYIIISIGIICDDYVIVNTPLQVLYGI